MPAPTGRGDGGRIEEEGTCRVAVFVLFFLCSHAAPVLTFPPLPIPYFFVTFSPHPLFTDQRLDGKHVVFGRVLEGMDVVKLIEEQGTSTGVPRCAIEISNCGEMC